MINNLETKQTFNIYNAECAMVCTTISRKQSVKSYICKLEL